MKASTIISVIGIILLIVGIVVLSYQRFTYTTQEKVAEIGNVQITAQNQKTVFFPPILGGLCIAAGVVLVIIGVQKKP